MKDRKKALKITLNVKLSRRLFFVQGKMPNTHQGPAYLENSWLRQS